MVRIVVSMLIMMTLALFVGCGGSSDRSESDAAESSVANAEAASEVDESTLPVSFSRSIKPIFEANCTYCHHSDHVAGVDLTDPFDPEKGIINRPYSRTASEKKFIVVPGDPEASALLHKIAASTVATSVDGNPLAQKVAPTSLDPEIDGSPMPITVPRVSADELMAMRTWIDGGAKDDDHFRAAIAPLFGDESTILSSPGKCAYCHYTGSPTGLDLTDVFNPETGAVGVPAVQEAGGIRIVPEDAYSSVLYVRSSAAIKPKDIGPVMPLRLIRLREEELGAISEWIAEGAKND
jgi:hypothetical protein